MTKQPICSICKMYYTELGNNAQPLNNGRCCDVCNNRLVIPARLKAAVTQRIKAESARKEVHPDDV